MTDTMLAFSRLENARLSSGRLDLQLPTSGWSHSFKSCPQRQWYD